jgi:hypothetical protein
MVFSVILSIFRSFIGGILTFEGSMTAAFGELEIMFSGELEEGL